MTFEEHLQNNLNADGSYDLDGAEEDRRYEIETSPEEQLKLAAKAARQEREAFMRNEKAKLRKQFEQPALSPDLELDVLVPLGANTAACLGDMNATRIRIRKDLRVEVHMREAQAFVAEITFWDQTLMLLADGETIAEAQARS